MAYNWRPKLAEVDPENPNAWARCDRCGFVTNIDKMVWQYSYQGSTSPQNTRILTCGRPTCLDPLNPQDAPYILPPDPEPIYNARPVPYVLDESSWLATQDGDQITTQDDERITPSIPNPDSIAATAHLQAQFRAPSASVAVAYYDIFNGNPLAGGVSVLSSITGSATRTNIAASLTTVLGIAKNPAQIIVAAASSATVNVNYFALYDAATVGTLVLSGPLSVNGPSVTVDNPVVFDPIGIQINLN